MAPFQFTTGNVRDDRQQVIGYNITRPTRLSFPLYSNPMRVEIRNADPQVPKIAAWNQPGNYFYKRESKGDFPALALGNFEKFVLDVSKRTDNDVRRAYTEEDEDETEEE